MCKEPKGGRLAYARRRPSAGLVPTDNDPYRGEDGMRSRVIVTGTTVIANPPAALLQHARSPTRRGTKWIIVCAPAWGKGRPPGESVPAS